MSQKPVSTKLGYVGRHTSPDSLQGMTVTRKRMLSRELLTSRIGIHAHERRELAGAPAVGNVKTTTGWPGHASLRLLGIHDGVSVYKDLYVFRTAGWSCRWARAWFSSIDGGSSE